MMLRWYRRYKRSPLTKVSLVGTIVVLVLYFASSTALSSITQRKDSEAGTALNVQLAEAYLASDTKASFGEWASAQPLPPHAAFQAGSGSLVTVTTPASIWRRMLTPLLGLALLLLHAQPVARWVSFRREHGFVPADWRKRAIGRAPEAGVNF